MEDKEFNERIKQLEHKCNDPRSGIDLDGLLDIIPALCDELSHPAMKASSNKNIETFLNKYEGFRTLIERSRITKADFQLKSVIGQGGFGKVQVVKHLRTGQVFAMKTMSKCLMMQRDDALFWEEREIMATANSAWIVRLCYAFQDTRNLYFVMEYMPGGNIAKLIEDFVIDESIARFYCAEVVLAVDVIHSLGFVHRDIKPDNLLLDSSGHIKLADFGTCMRVNKDGYVISGVAVGTPDYISPEVLESQTKPTKYGRECDWWSVGILLYEMFYGEAPFYAEALTATYGNIINHKEKLHFPETNNNGDQVPISSEAKALIGALLSHQKERLGRNGTDEIKAHPFFANDTWTWDNIRSKKAPFEPNLSGDDDTAYFDAVEKHVPTESFPPPKVFAATHLPFVGFTFNSSYKLLFGAVDGSKPAAVVEDEKGPKPPKEDSAHLAETESKLKHLTTELEQLRNELKSSQRLSSELDIELKDSQMKYDNEMEAHRKTHQRLREVEKEKQEMLGLQSSRGDLEVSEATKLKRQLEEAYTRTVADADAAQKLKKQVADLRQRAEKAEHETEKTEFALFEEEQQHQAAERDRTRAYEQLRVETSAKEDALRKVEELSTANNALCAEVQRAAQSQAQANAEVAYLKNEVENLKARIDREANRVDSPTTAIPPTGFSDDQAALEELRHQLDDEKVEYHKIADQLTEAQHQINELKIDEEALKTAQADVVRLSNELESVRARVEAENAQVLSTRRDLDHANQLLQEHKVEAEKTEELLKREKQRVIDDMTKVRETVCENEIKLKETGHLYDAESMMHRLLNSYRGELVQELEKHVKRAEDLAAMHRNLEAEHEVLSAEVTHLRQQAENEAKAKAIAKSHAAEALQKLQDDLTKKIADLEEQVRAEKAQNVSATADWSKKLDDAHGQLDRLTNEKRKIEEVCSQRLEEAHDLINSLKKKTMEADSPTGESGDLMNVTLMPTRRNLLGKVNFQAEYKRKKEDCLRLQKELGDQADRLQQQIDRYQFENNALRQQLNEETQAIRRIEGEKDQLREQLAVETQRSHSFETECEGLRADISEVQERLATLQSGTDTLIDSLKSVPIAPDLLQTLRPPTMQRRGAEMANPDGEITCGWLSIRKGSKGKKEWQRVFVVLTTNELQIFDSEAARVAGAEPLRTIDRKRLRHARKVNQDDLCHESSENIPKIFQLIFESPDGEPRFSETSTLSGCAMFKGHSLVKLMSPKYGAEPGSCEFCHRAFGGRGWSVTSILKGAVAVVQCRSCHSKFHKDHIDRKDNGVPSCKVEFSSEPIENTYFMAASPEGQSTWVAQLSKSILKESTSQLKTQAPVAVSMVEEDLDSTLTGKANKDDSGSDKRGDVTMTAEKLQETLDV